MENIEFSDVAFFAFILLARDFFTKNSTMLCEKCLSYIKLFVQIVKISKKIKEIFKKLLTNYKSCGIISLKKRIQENIGKQFSSFLKDFYILELENLADAVKLVFSLAWIWFC